MRRKFSDLAPSAVDWSMLPTHNFHKRAAQRIRALPDAFQLGERGLRAVGDREPIVR
jgi:hypothetical protein